PFECVKEERPVVGRRSNEKLVTLEKVFSPLAQQDRRGIEEVRLIEHVVTVHFFPADPRRIVDIERSFVSEAAEGIDLSGSELSSLDDQARRIPAPNQSEASRRGFN